MKRILVSSILLAVLFFPISMINGSVAYAFYSTIRNQPDRFCTDRGSYYRVREEEVIRNKYDGVESSGPKNMFYAKNYEDCKGADKAMEKGSNIESVMTTYDLMSVADIGRVPFDIILKENGKEAEDSRAHCGDKINVLRGEANAQYCYSKREH